MNHFWNAIWVSRFLDLADEVSTWSKDPSTKVGCVIVDAEKRVVGLGYNGFPRGVIDSHERLHNRETKLALTIHAEENAMLNAVRPVSGCVAFVTHPPCVACMARIIQAGIITVYYRLPAPEFENRWAASVAMSRELAAEVGVMVIGVGVGAGASG